jgi:hypothetical protein
MNEAQGALGAYAERPRSQLQNIDLHRRLAEELIKATNEYIRLIFEVGLIRGSVLLADAFFDSRAAYLQHPLYTHADNRNCLSSLDAADSDLRREFAVPKPWHAVLANDEAYHWSNEENTFRTSRLRLL